MRKVLLVFTLLLFSCFSSFAQTREFRELKIISTWGGLGGAQKSELLITHKSNDYYIKGNKIERQKIDDLLNAINEPEIKTFQAANLGITQEWLNVNAEPGVKEYANVYFLFAASNQKELYLSSYRDLQLVEKVLPDVLRGGWTDDYPRFTVEITGLDGSKSVISSDEQPTFMLPWKIEKNGQTIKTYNAGISRALDALLPENFANKDRLSGGDLRRVLATFIMRYIEDDWNILESENKAGDTLNILKKNYRIVSAEINSNHGVDFGKEWEKNKDQQSNLHLILKRDEFPKYFAIRLKLPFLDKKTESLNNFQSKIDKYQELIFSIPWLKNYLENKGTVELRFITSRSFSEKAMKKFAEDMNKIGKSDFVPEVEKEQENIALIGVGGGLEYYQSYWLVMPDKKVILWRYRYPMLMDWNQQNFDPKECTDEIAAGLKCIGAVISPEGNIISK